MKIAGFWLGVMLMLNTGGAWAQDAFAVRDPKKVYAEEGNGVIRGQALLRQRNGGVVTCAGNDVFLYPDLAEFEDIIQAAHAKQSPAPMTPEQMAVVKAGRCDALGEFHFSGLPLLSYVVVTNVSWRVGYFQQGGALRQKVTAKEGEGERTILSDQDMFGR